MIEFIERVQPDFTIRQCGDTDVYAVTHFKRRSVSVALRREASVYDDKLDQSISRARSMIKFLGLSNPWDWFATLTLDKQKYDRHDLGVFRKDLAQWMRDERKRYLKLYPEHTERLSFLLVPERHKDGAWHIHGLFAGIPEPELSRFDPARHPARLVRGGYFNWERYAAKFGFCSLGRVRNRFACVLYLLKYITKDLDACKDKGRHLYIPSRPLAGAVHCADVYGSRPELDKLCTQDFKFCKTGLVTGRPWWWSCLYDDDALPFALAEIPVDVCSPADIAVFTEQFEQLEMMCDMG